MLVLCQGETARPRLANRRFLVPVSYTHLTLPPRIHNPDYVRHPVPNELYVPEKY